MDLKQFSQAVQQIADEKGIAKEKILEAIEMALAAAYKRDYGKRGQIVRVKFDMETGKLEVRQIKIVVDETMIKSAEEIAAEEEERARRLAGLPAEEAEKRAEKEEEGEPASAESDQAMAGEVKKVRFNEEKHIMLEEARKIKPDVRPGDELEFELPSHDEFGRIAAQTAKQVIIQRIREVEREVVFEEYKNKEGELVSGLVQRIEGRNIFIDLGRTVGVLIPEEQVPGERYRIGERLKTLIILVEKNPRGPGIYLSRSHPRLLKKLFELEVPEIASGAVEIKAIAREPGQRSKVAVTSHEQGVDPVGSLVGQKGIRVTTVINELGGEKIDIIEWSEDPAKFIANALSPAKVLDVELNEDFRTARVIVPDEQQSLAIGRGGQNVRLAAKLTGWKIDVRAKKPGEDAEPEPIAEAEPIDEPVAEAKPEMTAKVEPEQAAETKEKEMPPAEELKEAVAEEKSKEEEKPEEEKKAKKSNKTNKTRVISNFCHQIS